MDNLLPRLITLLNSGGGTASATLKENAAITIGRLGGVVPEKVAPHLEIFIQPWWVFAFVDKREFSLRFCGLDLKGSAVCRCETLRDIRDNLEKESAFRGLVKMVEVKPTGVAQHFAYFCDAIVRWKRISPELNEMFRNVSFHSLRFR